MKIAPLPARRLAGRVAEAGSRNFGFRPANSGPSARNLARRRVVVTWAKLVLPLVALLLLATLALWPELRRETDSARLAMRGRGVSVDGGSVMEAAYNGVDARNRPYSLTATIARQINPDRIDLSDVKADLGGAAPGWLMIEANKGVYNQHRGQLDLAGDVKLYRDDGTTLLTDSAAIELKSGAAAGAEKVHVEGPFGQLDAQGFAFTDRGGVIQFTGPGHLVLNGHKP